MTSQTAGAGGVCGRQQRVTSQTAGAGGVCGGQQRVELLEEERELVARRFLAELVKQDGL